jgi:23S rRNA (guanosine2251-2'-O)-methyltransferase
MGPGGRGSRPPSRSGRGGGGSARRGGLAKGTGGGRSVKGKGGGPPPRARRDRDDDGPPFEIGRGAWRGARADDQFDDQFDERLGRDDRVDRRRRPRDDEADDERGTGWRGRPTRDADERPARGAGPYGANDRRGGYRQRDDREVSDRPARARDGGYRPGGFRPSSPRPGGSRYGSDSRDDERRAPWRDREADDRRPPARRAREDTGRPPWRYRDDDDRPPRRGAPFGGRADDRYERPGPPRRAAPPGDLLYGRNAVLEALKAGRPIRRVMVATGAHGGVITEIVDTTRARKINLQSVDRRRLDDLAFNHQGVVAEAAPYVYAPLEELVEAAKSSEHPLVLVLDVLQDPQNLGSLLRTAAAVGAQGAVIPEHRAVGVTPAVVKASAGAIERLKIAQVTNLSRAIDALKEVGLWAVGLDAHGDTRYDEADLNRPLALVVGGEGKGLRPLVRQHCDVVVSLPMPGAMESLNAAVAGSIALYEALRQRAQRAEPSGTSTGPEATGPEAVD